MANFLHNEQGATAIEYGLLTALIVVGIVGATAIIGIGISDTFSTLAQAIAQ
ncbi:MAG: Flp family type IVb pilin [Proteobacteria bacterium]|jgi:pilus assembly protein Flp/PilA|nr:Flp family type IVb pilin [Pseudomonadota bacterium]